MRNKICVLWEYWEGAQINIQWDRSLLYMEHLQIQNRISVLQREVVEEHQ